MADDLEKLPSDPVVYSYAPLKEAVVEVRFPGDPTIECHRDILFENIKAEFPDVSTPIPPVPLPPYRFQSLDGKRSVISSINMLAYTTQTYKHFYEFKDKVLPVTKFFFDAFKVTDLKRFGLRYVNKFPIIKEGIKIPLKNLLNLDFVFPVSMSADFSDIAFAVEVKMGAGMMTTRILSGKENGQDIIILDFDYYMTEKLTSSNIPAYLEEGHKNIKMLFESLVSENYKKVMRGEVLK